MIAPRLSVAISLTIAGLLPSAAVQPVSDRTLLEFSSRMRGLELGAPRVDQLIRIAWYERPGGELQAFTEAQLEEDCLSSPGSVIREFKSGSPYARRQAIALMSRRWEQLTKGSDPGLIDLVGQALTDSDEVIHRTAATIAATNVMEGIANQAIDAAIADPELTVAALRAIALANDETGARWSIQQMQSADPRIRQTALHTVARLARVTLPMLRVQLASPLPEERKSALDGLLLVATRDDVPQLMRWLEAPDDPQRIEIVTKAVAALEAGRYAPKLPAYAEPLFTTPLPDEAGPDKKRRAK